MRIMPLFCRYFFSVATLALFFFPSFAQKREFSGFYISRQGDTVKGVFSDYKQWNYNPQKVSFMPLATNQEVQLTPLTCTAFHIESNEVYISYQGKRMTNPISFSDASAAIATDTYDTITTFLRQIGANNEYKFYVYQDKIRMNLFYSKDDKVITELLQKGLIVNNTFWESMIYKQQLKELFPGEANRAAIDKLRYSEESLALFANMTNKGSKYVESGGKEHDGFFIIGGVSFNSFRFNRDRSQDFSLKDYPSNVVPLVAVGYLISFKRNFRKLFWFPELKVYSFKHTTTTVYNNSYPVFSNTFQSSPVLSLGFHLGYNIVNNPDFSASIAPGGGFTVLVKNRQIDEHKNSQTDSDITVRSMQRVSYLVDIRALMIIKKTYMMWFSYDLPTPVTDYVTSADLSVIQVGIGYKIGKKR